MKLTKAILTILIFIFGYTIVSACRCEDPGSVKDAFRYIPFLIHGKILSKKYVSFKETVKKNKIKWVEQRIKKGMRKSYESKLLISVKVEILQQFKGNNIRDTVTVVTPRRGASCGYNGFELDEEFIIYAYPKVFVHNHFILKGEIDENIEKEDLFWTNHCTRTCQYNKDEISELERICSSEMEKE